MQRRDFLRISAATAAVIPEMLHELVPAQAAQPVQAATPNEAAFAVSIGVDAHSALGELRPVWRFFGYDEPNYTYMKDGQKLLAELGRMGKPQVYVRTHHLLTSGDGTPGLKWGSTNAYTEDNAGKPVYDWSITDRIFSTYLERGLKPYVQIGFMPEALSTHPQDYPRNQTPDKPLFPGSGFSYPPRDYAKWGELCFRWAEHCAAKFGADEAASWYWEVWNEPNIDYWKGTPQEFHKLYDFAVEGVRRALPTALVGGPETAGGPGGRFLHDFLEHCLRGTNYATGKIGAPLDFLSFHAKGSPSFVGGEGGHVRMGISHQLNDIDAGFSTIASFPELKSLPIVIGESDPEGCAACKGPQNGYRNGTMYSSYTAASFARKHELAARYNINFEGALTWAFEFENQPYFAGFRALASRGIDHPVLNVFRMMARMNGQRLTVHSTHAAELDSMLKSGVRDAPDVSALASLDQASKKLSVLLWHYHDDDLPGPDANVDLALNGLPPNAHRATLRHFRVDKSHSNAFEVWKQLGSPQQPTREQYAQLEQAGHLALLGAPQAASIEGGLLKLPLLLPRQAVSLLEIEWM